MHKQTTEDIKEAHLLIIEALYNDYAQTLASIDYLINMLESRKIALPDSVRERLERVISQAHTDNADLIRSMIELTHRIEYTRLTDEQQSPKTGDITSAFNRNTVEIQTQADPTLALKILLQQENNALEQCKICVDRNKKVIELMVHEIAASNASLRVFQGSKQMYSKIIPNDYEARKTRLKTQMRSKIADYSRSLEGRIKELVSEIKTKPDNWEAIISSSTSCMTYITKLAAPDNDNHMPGLSERHLSA